MYHIKIKIIQCTLNFKVYIFMSNQKLKQNNLTSLLLYQKLFVNLFLM